MMTESKNKNIIQSFLTMRGRICLNHFTSKHGAIALVLAVCVVCFMLYNTNIIYEKSPTSPEGVWRALDGTRVLQFNTSTAVSQCLKGKVLHLYGDSTIRQWFEYLTESLPGLKKFDLKTPKQNGPFLALDPENNILVTFRCHGPPIHFATMPANQARYIASELDSVIGGKDTVVVIGVWSHFSTFPIEVYIRRLLSIRRAVVQLLTKAPGTVVIIRTANPKALTVYETLTNSDWYSLQRDKVLREIFKGVNVQLVDAWEMSIAHHLPHSIHPQPPIIKNMIDVILSHTCPAAASSERETKL